MKFSDEHMWQRLQDARQDRYLDRLCMEHVEGYHDLPGEEVENCPACEIRREDEETVMREDMEEETK